MYAQFFKVMLHTIGRAAPISDEELSRVCVILGPYAHKWKQIGLSLGFTRPELSNIEVKPALFSTAPQSYMHAMLSDWQQWSPGDYRGSHDYATLTSLQSAVDRAGLGGAAQEIGI